MCAEIARVGTHTAAVACECVPRGSFFTLLSVRPPLLSCARATHHRLVGRQQCARVWSARVLRRTACKRLLRARGSCGGCGCCHRAIGKLIALVRLFCHALCERRSALVSELVFSLFALAGCCAACRARLVALSEVMSLQIIDSRGLRSSVLASNAILAWRFMCSCF